MERPLLLAFGCAALGALSFATLAMPKEGPISHMAENATWALVIGAVVLALLAADGAKDRRGRKALIGAGVFAAALRAASLFVL